MTPIEFTQFIKGLADMRNEHGHKDADTRIFPRPRPCEHCRPTERDNVCPACGQSWNQTQVLRSGKEGRK